VYGEAAADDLAERRHVRLDAEIPLRTGEATDPEARDHLVEHQESTVLVAQVAEVLVVAVDGRDDTPVAEDRLRQHGGDLVAVALEDVCRRLPVVERHREGVSRELVGDARRGRSRVAGVALDERRLLCAVVAALHDDDLVAVGMPAGESNGGDGRLRAAVDEPHRVDGGDVPGDELREFDLHLRRRAVHRALGGV